MRGLIFIAQIRTPSISVNHGELGASKFLLADMLLPDAITAATTAPYLWVHARLISVNAQSLTVFC